MLRLHLLHFLLLYKKIWTLTLQTVLEDRRLAEPFPGPWEGLLRRTSCSPLFANNNRPTSAGGAKCYMCH